MTILGSQSRRISSYIYSNSVFSFCSINCFSLEQALICVPVFLVFAPQKQDSSLLTINIKAEKSLIIKPDEEMNLSKICSDLCNNL